MHVTFPASRKSICILVAGFVLAASLAMWWLLNGAADEPSHGGHRLSHWVQRYETAADAGPYMPFRLSAESAAAVREIGTNALPTLLQSMTRPEQGLKGKIVTWANDDRIPSFARRMLVPAYPKSYRPDWAILAFRVLGSDAEDALPSLVHMLHAPNNARWATMALCAVGPGGATALEQAFPTIGEGLLRANIILQLEHGISPALASYYAPVLAHRLREDSHAAARMSAAQVLGKLTNSAAVVVPVLVEALSHSDAGVRFSAAQSLAHFGPEAVGAIPSLEAALNDENPQVRTDAAQALRAIRRAGAVGDEGGR